MDVDLSQLQAIINDRATAINFVCYCLAAMAGQFGYASKLWLAKEIDCVMDRFRQDPRATILALLTNFSTIGGVAILIPFGQMPMQAAILMGFMQGWTADSAVNKSVRPIWTDAQRAAKVGS